MASGLEEAVNLMLVGKSAGDVNDSGKPRGISTLRNPLECQTIEKPQNYMFTIFE